MLYIFKEAELPHNGNRLSAVDGRVVAEVFLGCSTSKGFLSERGPYIYRAGATDHARPECSRLATCSSSPGWPSCRESLPSFIQLRSWEVFSEVRSSL